MVGLQNLKPVPGVFCVLSIVQGCDASRLCVPQHSTSALVAEVEVLPAWLTTCTAGDERSKRRVRVEGQTRHAALVSRHAFSLDVTDVQWHRIFMKAAVAGKPAMQAMLEQQPGGSHGAVEVEEGHCKQTEIPADFAVQLE